MDNFYADNEYYIDLSKIIFLEFFNGDDRYISIHLFGGNAYTFHEKYEYSYKVFKFLKEWHEKKIKEMK